MNESFDLKRFLALAKPAFLKRQLIGTAILIVVLTAIYSFQKTSSNFFVIGMVLLGSANYAQFRFLSSKSGFANFLLLPATYSEKFLALLTNVIVYPFIQLIIIIQSIRWLSTSLPASMANKQLGSEQLYVVILLFVILFSLRFVLRWNSHVFYFMLYIVTMIPIMWAEKYINHHFGNLPNYPIYHLLSYIMLSVLTLSVAYSQMKRQTINRIKTSI